MDVATLANLLHETADHHAKFEAAAPPQPLADLIRRLLARDPDARPASALAVVSFSAAALRSAN